MNYLEEHKNLLVHYEEGNYNDCYLVFTKEWRDKNLPKERSDDFHIVYKDTTDGKFYESKIYVAYEETSVLDDDYQSVDVWRLHGYFYSEHHCPCHRKSDVKSAGAETDTECEGNRFLIDKITPPNSDIILMSETRTGGELESYING